MRYASYTLAMEFIWYQAHSAETVNKTKVNSICIIHTDWDSFMAQSDLAVGQRGANDTRGTFNDRKIN